MKEYFYISNKNIKVDYQNIFKAHFCVRAVWHPIRKQIIKLLVEKEQMNVTDIHSQLDVNQSIISLHLSILRKTGFIQANRKGKFVYYSINHKQLNRFQSFIENF